MNEGVRGPAIEAGLIEPDLFDAGIEALRRTTEAGGVFCYPGRRSCHPRTSFS